MKLYTVVGGIEGVGKTSLLGVLDTLNTDIGVILDEDILRYRNCVENIDIKSKVEDCFKQGINFTQEDTLVGTTILKIIRRAIDLDYYIKLYYIGLDSCEDSLVRVANRVCKGGRNVDSLEIRNSYNQRVNDLLKVIYYCHEVIFFDNTRGYQYLGTYKNGQLLKAVPKLPLWLEEVERNLNGYMAR